MRHQKASGDSPGERAVCDVFILKLVYDLHLLRFAAGVKPDEDTNQMRPFTEADFAANEADFVPDEAGSVPDDTTF